ncbi:MAG: tetratricopeptide repeat protein [Bdellovibrionota bacterium]
MKKFFWLLLPFLISCDKNPDPRTLWHNRESLKQLSNKNLEQSQKELIDAFQFDPYQFELHLNLGFNLELQKDNEKALKQYSAAEVYAQNPFQRFVSRFNRAQLLAQEKKVEEALAEYQRALEIAPSSKEVKTNIELLIQQQEGQGQGKGEDQKNKEQDKDSEESKDKKDGENKDQDKKDKDDKDGKKEEKKDYKPNQKYKPREFKGELNPSDIKKILDEIKQQEQKIRAEYNKKNDYKERPRDKDW